MFFFSPAKWHFKYYKIQCLHCTVTANVARDDSLNLKIKNIVFGSQGMLVVKKLYRFKFKVGDGEGGL